MKADHSDAWLSASCVLLSNSVGRYRINYLKFEHSNAGLAEKRARGVQSDEHGM